MLLDVRGLSLHTPEGRPLVKDLTLQLDRERVALIGRNGVGKSTLLRALAQGRPEVRHAPLAYVPQHLDGAASPGQLRWQALAEAFTSGTELLLLDEPSEDLDPARTADLVHRIRGWRGGLVAVTHDPELLDTFDTFFVMDDGGCQVKQGCWEEVQQALVAEADAKQDAYVRRLEALERSEARHHRIQRRRDRKRNVGRIHELDRSQSKMRLNQRKSAAQVSQAKVNARQQDRRDAERAWAHAARQALTHRLPLDLVVPVPPTSRGPVIRARGLPGLGDLDLDRQRLGVVGPNGSGKSTLLDTLTGHRRPEVGSLHLEAARMGVIQQQATNWQRPESLLELLGDAERAAERVVAHRFPLGLAARPLAELSPGERTRAALIALFDQDGLELLVLDEPTGGLDLVGVHALQEVLRAWRAGLVVASHDRRFLAAVGVELLGLHTTR